MFKKFVVLFLVSVMAFPACIPPAVFPAVASVVSDATAVLNIMQQASNSWFRHKPDPELQMQVDDAISTAWTSLRLANRTMRGAEDLSQEDYDAAFAEFRESYAELHKLLKDNGILNGTKLSMGGPGSATQEIAPPDALSFKVDE